MNISLDLIIGLSLGFEFAEDVDDDSSYLIIDVCFIRFLIQLPRN